MRARRSSSAAAWIAVAMTLGACGGASAPTPKQKAYTQRVSTAALEHACPPSGGHMGCALPHPTRPSTGYGSVPSGTLLPDVSSYQPNVDWAAVKAWQLSHHMTPSGIFKTGEYVIDPWAHYNATHMAALGMWRAGYWFVRNTGCTNEMNQIASEARALGLKVVVLDLEVPEAAGYGACLSPGLRRAGFIVVEYTAPGTNPGGADTSDPLWIATYGSGFSCMWTCNPVAWQFTDGVYGAVVNIPGIGKGDVNQDRGITRLAPVVVKPPRVHCFGPARQKTAACAKVRAQVGRQARARDATLRAIDRSHCLYTGIVNGKATALFHQRSICDKLERRAGYFAQRVTANLY